MQSAESSIAKPTFNRLLSLDFMRGLIMFLLALEASELYHHIIETTKEGSVGHFIILQFFHKGWEGIRFWDLIQPAFMFMAGIAMTYSLTNQAKKGYTWNQQFKKVLIRSGWLLFWGILKRVHSPDWLLWESLDVTDILTQLAFTNIIAFLLFNLQIRNQFIACFGILILTELLYRLCNVSGFDQGYTQAANFGNWIDYILFGQRGNTYVFINWLPTAVHTLAGVMVGKVLMNNPKPIKGLLITGFSLLVLGYCLDYFGLTPIIKPIATSSFILVSLGYCLLIVAALYWWIDIKMNRKGLLFFQVIGMNSIFIYLFFDIVGRHWFNDYVFMVIKPIFLLVNLNESLILILSSLCVFALEWGICYFLYKKKIFFRV